VREERAAVKSEVTSGRRVVSIIELAEAKRQ